MTKKIEFSNEQRKYWANIFIAVSQITFAGAWAILFIPSFDLFKGFVIVLNLTISALLWLIGWLIIRRVK